MKTYVDLRLTLDVEYVLNGESVQYLKECLERVAFRAASEGLLTGESVAYVEKWDSRVEEVI